MPPVNSIRNQRALQEAEGYLRLLTALPECMENSDAHRGAVVQRALDCLDSVEADGGKTFESESLRGSLLRAVQRYEEAVPCLESALQRCPENISVALALAWCSKRTDHLDQAIDTLEDALVLAPLDPILNYNLACYWSLAGDVPRSIYYLGEALSIEPHLRQAIKDEPDFDSMRDIPAFRVLAGESDLNVGDQGSS